MIYFYRYGRADSTAIARFAAIGFDYPVLFRYLWARDCPAGGQVSDSEQRHKMNRKAIHQAIKSKGIEGAMRVPKGTLTPKMKRFAEEIALGSTGADAYRRAYSDRGSVDTIGNNASRLKADARIKAEIERIERANELAALHSAAGLHSIVISTLAEIATNPEAKDATRIQAVRSIGQLVGVDAFRETKRVEHVKDSGEIRAQILDQLKSMMLGSADAVDVDANSLLVELAGDEPQGGGTPPNAEWDSDAHMHSNELEPSQSFSDPEDSGSPSEDPPSSLETQTPRGDIFAEKGDVNNSLHGRSSK